MTPTRILMIAGSSALAEELSKEVRDLVSDFRARRPEASDIEIDAGLAHARHEIRGPRLKSVLTAGAVALGLLALGAVLALGLWS